MKNITITVPETVAKWARVWAARNNTSVSKIVGELLATRMNQENAYESAMRRFLSTSPRKLRESNQRYPSRERLHER